MTSKKAKNRRRSSSINFEDFVSFCKWFSPTLVTLNSISSEWQCCTPTKLIHGFCCRDTTERMLESNPKPGVFLIRCSETKPGWLALSFNDEKKSRGGILEVKSDNHCLVQVEDDGFTIYFQKNQRRKYAQLRDLILSAKKLKTLHSDTIADGIGVSKEHLFSSLQLSVYAFVQNFDGNSSNSRNDRSGN